MDPISTLFAAYLTTVSSNFQKNITDIYGTEVTSELITYQDTPISFQYQIWKIKNKSVCANYKNNTSIYSDCTIKAKSLFSDLCNKIPQSNNWKIKKLRNMYCNASISYSPTIAKISLPKPDSEQRLLEKQCNVLILKTMGNKNKDLLAEKRLICGKASSIRE